MEHNSKTIILDNRQYSIPYWLYNQLYDLGIEFNGEYISYLLNNNSPLFGGRSITVLTNMDIKNRKYIGSSGLYGKIIKLNKIGEAIDSFENVYEAAIDSLTNSCKYTFEALYNSKICINKQHYHFFGKRIVINPTDININIIKSLNSTICRCRNIFKDKNNKWQNYYKKNLYSKMTYQEFIDLEIRVKAFEQGEMIDFLLSNTTESKYTAHDIKKCEKYQEMLNNLIKKYSCQGKSAFEKIYNLNDIENYKGIYLLCIPQIKGCYVGQTKTSFGTRIPQHFSKPNSAFDIKYKPEDIKEIYVMQLDETLHAIDYIEQDCIATLGPDICLNVMAGGCSIELLKSEKYNPKSHTINHDLLQWVIKDSINITNYHKNSD